MNRRSLLTGLATVALVAVPAAAMAYDAPGFNTTVNDPTITAGQSVTITTTGADAGERLTLTVTSDPASISNDAITIAGTKALAKTASATGAASWTVTLAATGTYRLAVTDAAGALLGDESVTVSGAPAAAGGLSDTGFDPTGMAVGAGALIVAGAGAVVVARRRQLARAGA